MVGERREVENTVFFFCSFAGMAVSMVFWISRPGWLDVGMDCRVEPVGGGGYVDGLCQVILGWWFRLWIGR